MSLEATFLRDIFFNHHPDFIADADLRIKAMQYPRIIKITLLHEEALAHTSKRYNRIDGHGQDFDDVDNSDAKTGTVIKYTRISKKTGKLLTNYRAEIGGIHNKVGSIRLSLYNPHKNCIDYFYIPKQRVAVVMRDCFRTKSTGSKRLSINWSPDDDSYNMYDEFRLQSFEQLATAQDPIIQDQTNFEIEQTILL